MAEPTRLTFLTRRSRAEFDMLEELRIGLGRLGAPAKQVASGLTTHTRSAETKQPGSFLPGC